MKNESVICNDVERIVGRLAKSKGIVMFHKSLAKKVEKEWEKKYAGEIQWMGFGGTIHAMRIGRAYPRIKK